MLVHEFRFIFVLVRKAQLLKSHCFRETQPQTTVPPLHFWGGQFFFVPKYHFAKFNVCPIFQKVLLSIINSHPERVSLILTSFRKIVMPHQTFFDFVKWLLCCDVLTFLTVHLFGSLLQSFRPAYTSFLFENFVFMKGDLESPLFHFPILAFFLWFGGGEGADVRVNRTAGEIFGVCSAL